MAAFPAGPGRRNPARATGTHKTRREGGRYSETIIGRVKRPLQSDDPDTARRGGLRPYEKNHRGKDPHA